MVGTLGMGGSLVSWEAAAVGGAANTVAKVLADEASRAAVNALLDDANAVAERLVRAHGHILEALRDALLSREELVGDEILEVIRSAEVGALGSPGGDQALLHPGGDEMIDLRGAAVARGATASVVAEAEPDLDRDRRGGPGSWHGSRARPFFPTEGGQPG